MPVFICDEEEAINRARESWAASECGTVDEGQVLAL